MTKSLIRVFRLISCQLKLIWDRSKHQQRAVTNKRWEHNDTLLQMDYIFFIGLVSILIVLCHYPAVSISYLLAYAEIIIDEPGSTFTLPACFGHTCTPALFWSLRIITLPRAYHLYWYFQSATSESLIGGRSTPPWRLKTIKRIQSFKWQQTGIRSCGF